MSRKPRSPVISEPKDWADESLLIPHEALRLIMDRMKQAVESLAQEDKKTEKLQLFYTYYETYFHFLVRHHHDAEEQIYFPWLRSKVVLPEKIADDHEELLQKMDTISKLGKAMENNMDESLAQKNYDELKVLLEDLLDALDAHLNEEEEIVPEALRENFAESEEWKILIKIAYTYGYSGNKKMTPLVYDAICQYGGKEKADEWKTKFVKGPVNMLWWYWMDKYRTQHLELLNKINPKICPPSS